MRHKRSMSRRRKTASLGDSADMSTNRSQGRSLISSASSRFKKGKRIFSEKYRRKSYRLTSRSRRPDESRRHYNSHSVSGTSSGSLSHGSLYHRSRHSTVRHRACTRSISRTPDCSRSRRSAYRCRGRELLRDSHAYHNSNKRRDGLSRRKTSSYWRGPSRRKLDSSHHYVKPHNPSQVQQSPSVPLAPYKSSKDARFSRRAEGRPLTFDRKVLSQYHVHRRPNVYPLPVTTPGKDAAVDKHESFSAISRNTSAKPYNQRCLNYKQVPRTPFPNGRAGRRRAASPATWSHDQFFEMQASTVAKKRSIVNLYAETFDQLIVAEAE